MLPRKRFADERAAGNVLKKRAPGVHWKNMMAICRGAALLLTEHCPKNRKIEKWITSLLERGDASERSENGKMMKIGK